MRIISGKYKGRVIKMPKGVRPTQNKVRKALFDILGDIEGLTVLELFAGSGAVGIEALSHGAKKVIFVENGPDCIKALKTNLASLLIAEDSLLVSDVSLAIKRLAEDRKKFDLIFLDPPYHQELVKKTLQTLGAYDILAPVGFIVVQHFKKDNLPDNSGDLVLFKQAKYGDTNLSFYKKNVPESNISR